MLKIKLIFALLLGTAIAFAQGPRITTSQYDNFRSGANLQERVLMPRSVNDRQFGKLFSLPVDGDVYAQPLYLPSVNVPEKGVRNLLFIATEHNSVYAFDADNTSTTPVWHVNLLPANGSETAVPARDVQCPFIAPEVGITSTPVIDMATGTIYVLARSKKKNLLSYEYCQRLHALAITTGAENSAAR